MHQVAASVMETDPLFFLWVASQRPGKHFLVQCEPGGFDALAVHATTLCAAPVRWCRLPGRLQLPEDKQGTLLLNDIASLTLQDQIALYDWLGRSGGDLRLIAGTTVSMAPLVAHGKFLEGLFNRISDVQFDLTSREYAR
jgi:transcriptional regulator of aromatic amino acid metabolism